MTSIASKITDQRKGLASAPPSFYPKSRNKSSMLYTTELVATGPGNDAPLARIMVANLAENKKKRLSGRKNGRFRRALTAGFVRTPIDRQQSSSALPEILNKTAESAEPIKEISKSKTPHPKQKKSAFSPKKRVMGAIRRNSDIVKFSEYRDDSHFTAKKRIPKGIITVIMSTEETNQREIEEKEAASIYRRFKSKGILIDRHVVENSILHPQNFHISNIEPFTNREKEEESPTPKSILGAADKTQKKKNTALRKNELISLFTVPKEDPHRERFQTIHSTTKIYDKSKAKIDCWWSRAESQALQINIAEYKMRKARGALNIPKKENFHYVGNISAIGYPHKKPAEAVIEGQINFFPSARSKKTVSNKSSSIFGDEINFEADNLFKKTTPEPQGSSIPEAEILMSRLKRNQRGSSNFNENPPYIVIERTVDNKFIRKPSNIP